MDIASYITGFVDGEGSFLVSFSRRPAFQIGVEVRPSFSISQHKRNREILDKLQAYFSCGSIRFDQHDQTYKYEVRSLDNLIEKIIPHFEHRPLQTSKKKDFEALRAICLLMKANRHYSPDGIEEIIRLGYSMNNLGARKYNKDAILRAVRKMKV